MNVLHLVHGRVFTGPAAASLTDVRALRAAGHEASLGGRTGGWLDKGCAEQNVPFVGGFKLGRGAARVLRLPGDVRRLRRVIDEHRLEVIHVHRSDDHVLAHLAVNKHPHCQLVRTWHRDPALVAGPLRRKLARMADANVCVSAAHVPVLREALARRAVYLAPGVDTGLYRPLRASSEHGAPFEIGLVGRWKAKEDRGQRAFLEVLKHLPADLPWRAVLLGRGEGRADLEKALAAHPARERIALEETGDDYPARLARLDVGLVFATGSDGSSRPAMELLACGVPLLAADQPGLRDLAEEGHEGVQVLPAQNLHAWAGTCGELLKDPARLSARKQSARAQAEAVHALAKRGAALADLYHMA